MIPKLYVHKVFLHDLTHEVGFTQEIHYDFFERSYSLSFTKNGGPTLYYVTVNDATDLRFGGEFKSILPYNLEVGDFICIEKNSGSYNLYVERKGSASAVRYNGLLGYNQRHLIFSNGAVVYKR